MANTYRPNQMDEGPWLDRLFAVRLPTGRVASATHIAVHPTNYGILEGGLDAACNARQRKWIESLAEKQCGGPVVAVEPTIVPLPEFSKHGPRERLPWMACFARLTSAPLEEGNTASELTVVWWTDVYVDDAGGDRARGGGTRLGTVRARCV